MKWVVEHVFSTTDAHRLEATTRVDNAAMIKVLERCGFEKEAHYRKAWKTKDGWMDSVGYAILREDKK